MERLQAGSASSGTEESSDEHGDVGGSSTVDAAGIPDEDDDSPVRPNTNLSLLDQHHELKRLVEGLLAFDNLK